MLYNKSLYESTKYLNTIIARKQLIAAHTIIGNVKYVIKFLVLIYMLYMPDSVNIQLNIKFKTQLVIISS